MENIQVAISGASGFIGSFLTKYFTEKGYKIVPLGRKYFKPKMEDELLSILENSQVVINLAGSTIARRWTPWAKDEILESRIGPTRILVHAINRLVKKPEVFISASAVGIYPSDYNIYRETDIKFGDNFLSQVCQKWENELKDLSPEVRVCVIRLGLVWSDTDGILPKMLLPFRIFMGGMIGNGYQPLSWIHLEDVARGIDFLIEHKASGGIYNFTSPDVINNRKFTQIAAKLLVRPTWLNIPPILLRILLGGAASLMVKGQAAYPERLIEEGFTFKHTDAAATLKQIISEPKKKQS
ncbi:MAG: TIGR01777 family oxidoreductase [Bacteroidales bacterium]